MKVIIPASMQSIHDAWHFSPAVIDGDRLWCSGIIGLRPDATVPQDAAEQFTLAFENLRDLLADAGCTFADVVELTSYHVGLRAHAEAFMAVKDSFLPRPYPAWTAVGISELAVPGALVEIRAVARLDKSI